MTTRTIEDEINPPLSSAVVIEPSAVKEEIVGEDKELAEMAKEGDLEKNANADVVESVVSEEGPPKPPIQDLP